MKEDLGIRLIGWTGIVASFFGFTKYFLHIFHNWRIGDLNFSWEDEARYFGHFGFWIIFSFILFISGFGLVNFKNWARRLFVISLLLWSVLTAYGLYYRLFLFPHSHPNLSKSSFLWLNGLLQVIVILVPLFFIYYLMQPSIKTKFKQQDKII